MVVRISGSTGITFNEEPFATEPFVTAALEDVPVFQKKIARFTGDGTWTVPAGVTYAIAYVMGGGGGSGLGTTGGSGGNSSVAFTGLTVTGPGSPRSIGADTATPTKNTAGPANSGQTASAMMGNVSNGNTDSKNSANIFLVGGATVTPGASITVTVGAGGSAGTGGAAGGSGYVYIEYYEEI